MSFFLQRLEPKDLIIFGDCLCELALPLECVAKKKVSLGIVRVKSQGCSVRRNRLVQPALMSHQTPQKSKSFAIVPGYLCCPFKQSARVFPISQLNARHGEKQKTD